METIYKEDVFPRFVNAEIEKRGMSILEIAHKVSITEKEMKKYLRGIEKMPDEVMHKCLEVLGFRRMGG